MLARRVLSVSRLYRDSISRIPTSRPLVINRDMATITQNAQSKPSRTVEFPLQTEALVVREPKDPFVLTPITLDEVRPDEVLVEMKFSGICHTDIVLQQGLLPMVEFPAIFGHEGAGVVRAIGSGVKNKSIQIGDHVLLSFNVCGDCKQCKSGHPAYCHTHPQINHGAVRRDGSTPGKLLDGQVVRSQYFGHSSFSKMSVVSEKCVVKCPYPDSMAIYAPLGCGFQTGAGTILNVLRPQTQQSIVICGIGGVGLAAVMAAKYLGVHQVIAVDLVNERLELAKELGATHVINSRQDTDIVKSIKDLTDGGANFAVDCTGVVPVIEQLIDCIGPRGVVAAVGVPPAGKKIRIDPLAFLLENKTYVGVIEGDSVPDVFIPQLMELHRSGHFPIERLCKIYPLEKLEVALADLKSGNVIKPVLQY